MNHRLDFFIFEGKVIYLRHICNERAAHIPYYTIEWLPNYCNNPPAWYIEDDEWGNAKISFCPYCGINLYSLKPEDQAKAMEAEVQFALRGIP